MPFVLVLAVAVQAQVTAAGDIDGKISKVIAAISALP
jgi:hypothetical protein